MILRYEEFILLNEDKRIWGRTALDLVEDNKIKELLLQHGAKYGNELN